MRQHQMNAADLARASGLSEAAISYILSGKRQPLGDTLVRIAKTLETSTDYLTGATDNPFTEKAEPLPPLALDVLAVMRRMSAARQAELLRIAKTFEQADREAPLVTPEDLIELLLDEGDQLVGEDVVDTLTQLLQVFERRANGRFLPGDADSQEPGEDEA